MPINLTLQSTDNDGIINLSSDTFNEREIMKKIQIEKEYGKEIKQVSSGKYWYVRLHNKEKILRKSKTREGLIQSIYDYYNNHEKTIEAVYKEMLHNKIMRHTKQSTIDRIDSDYKKYLSNTNFMQISITSIRQEDFCELIRDHFAVNFYQQMKKKALNNVFSVINAIFDYAFEKKYTQIDSRRFLQLYRKIYLTGDFFIFDTHPQSDCVEEVFLIEEDKKLINYLKEHSNDLKALAILFDRYTGLRNGELVSLKLDDFSIRTQELIIRRTETFDSINKTHTESRTKGKGRKYYPVLLTNDALNIYNQILKVRNPNSEFLFSTSNGRHYTRSELNKYLKSVCNLLNIKYHPMRGVRKTFASECAENQLQATLLAEQMGHKSIRTAQEYYIKNRLNQASKLEQLNNIIH